MQEGDLPGKWPRNEYSGVSDIRCHKSRRWCWSKFVAVMLPTVHQRVYTALHDCIYLLVRNT